MFVDAGHLAAPGLFIEGIAEAPPREWNLLSGLNGRRWLRQDRSGPMARWLIAGQKCRHGESPMADGTTKSAIVVSDA
ncbi:hypothetical protein ACP6JA_08360 [Stutzerimonas frequens]